MKPGTHMHQQTDVGDYGKFKCNPVFVIGRYADQIRSSLHTALRRMSRYSLRAQLATGRGLRVSTPATGAQGRGFRSSEDIGIYTGSTRCIAERRTTNDERRIGSSRSRSNSGPGADSGLMPVHSGRRMRTLALKALGHASILCI